MACLYNTFEKTKIKIIKKAGIIKLILDNTLKMNFIYIININEKQEKELTGEGRRIHSFYMVSNFRP